MNTTNNFLVSLLSNICIDNYRVIEMLISEGKNTDDILRIFNYLESGDKPEVPQKHVEKNGEVYTLIDYNIFTDTVTYSYISKVTCYLKDGDKFDENKIYDSVDDLPGFTWKKADAIEVKLKCIKRNSMTLGEWIRK